MRYRSTYHLITQHVVGVARSS